MARVQIFLSTVSAEFRSYRDALRHDLDRPNVTAKVQEDFIATGTETLDLLDGYIKQCDAVIHLVGDMTGAPAQAPSVTAIRQRYPDFDKRLPFLSPFLLSDGPALPYTQWEAWLALYHGKRLIICAPEKGAPRDERYRVDPGQIAAQRAHLERLASVEHYPRYFANADRLAVDVLRSQLLNILASAEAAESAGAVQDAIKRPTRTRERITLLRWLRQMPDDFDAYFRTLWQAGFGKDTIPLAEVDRLDATVRALLGDYTRIIEKLSDMFEQTGPSDRERGCFTEVFPAFQRECTACFEASRTLKSGVSAPTTDGKSVRLPFSTVYSALKVQEHLGVLRMAAEELIIQFPVDEVEEARRESTTQSR